MGTTPDPSVRTAIRNFAALVQELSIAADTGQSVADLIENICFPDYVESAAMADDWLDSLEESQQLDASHDSRP